MADIVIPEGSPVNGVQRYKHYVDQGDGTWAEFVATTGGSGGSGMFKEGASGVSSAVIVSLTTSATMPTIDLLFPRSHSLGSPLIRIVTP